MQYHRKCLFYQEWLTACKGEFLALQIWLAQGSLMTVSLISLKWCIQWNFCHSGFLSLGNFVIRFSHFHVHNLSPVAGVDLPSPPLIFLLTTSKCDFCHITLRGVLLPWRLGSNWHFGAQNLAHFWGGFVIFILLLLLCGAKIQFLGQIGPPKLIWLDFQLQLNSGFQEIYVTPPRTPWQKSCPKNLHFGLAFSKFFF